MQSEDPGTNPASPSPTPGEDKPARSRTSPTEPTPAGEPSFLFSLREVLGYRSFSVYLVTAWILGVFAVIQGYITLYLRDLLDYNYVLVGVLFTTYIAVEAVTRLMGGYVGDNYNRKHLSVLTMFVSGIGFLILGLGDSLLWMVCGLGVLASSSLFASGSTSYIYENIPREKSGLAMGLLQTGSGFGLIGLGLITWLLGIGTPFLDTIRFMFLLGGVLYMLAALIRAIFLEPTTAIHRKDRESNTVRDFLQQNWHALRLIFSILPVFMVVLILDAVSDGLYMFVSMYYLNESLQFSIGEISLMLLVVLAISIPLSIVVGGFFDRHGSRRAILVVYSVMPLALVLLLVAPFAPYWLPPAVVVSAASLCPALVPLMSTAFVAIACKRINDILWWTLILTYLRRAIPRADTAKMLSIGFIITMLATLFTPIPAGITYTLYGAIPILVVALAINLVILGILYFGNIEPKTASGME